MLDLNRKNRNLFKTLYGFVALGFGSGLFRIMPGTFGSLVGLIFGVALYSIFSIKHAVIIIFIAYLIGIWICTRAEDFLGKEDAKQIVWDEIVAMALVVILMPEELLGNYFYALLFAFFIFRFFDIVKPLWIRRLENYFDKGHAIMVDDLVAAIYTLVLLFIVHTIDKFIYTMIN